MEKCNNENVINDRITERNILKEKGCLLSFRVKNKSMADMTEYSANNAWNYNGNNGNLNNNNKNNMLATRPVSEFQKIKLIW